MKTATHEGQVGIFWFHEGLLMPVLSPVHEAERRGRMLDSPLAHVKEWPRLVARYKAAVPMRLILEYDQVPRGRVILDADTRTFIVYLDQALFVQRVKGERPDAQVRDAILDAFALRRERVVFRTDPHYNTPPWDRIDIDEDQCLDS